MSVLTDTFGYFDPFHEYTVTYGQLPHWEQAGATYLITWRTGDSIPTDAFELWERRKRDALQRLGVDIDVSGWKRNFEKLPWKTRHYFFREFAKRLELNLDELHGKCELRNPACSEIVEENLLRFSGDRYALGGFVVMPNHVHVLVCFHRDVALLEQCYNWKHFTSRRINSQLGRSGHFWQSESFDHLVRDVEHLVRFRNYLRENPKKAGLANDEYRLYLPDLGLGDV